jgi:rubredoxin
VSYLNHLELPSAPAGDEVIWRYLPLAQLLKILNEQTLHFTRVDRLCDYSLDIENQVALNVLAGIPAESTRRAFNLMKSAQSAVFSNNWYENGSHAHLRWEMHGGNDEVAIRTTVDTLKKALSPSSQKIYMSSVQYVDFACAPMPTGNVFLPALHKPHELRDEKEILMLLLQTGGQAVFSPGPEQGVEVRIDAASLIKGVRVPPRSASSFRSQVLSIADHYRLNFESTHSAVERVSPHHQLRVTTTIHQTKGTCMSDQYQRYLCLGCGFLYDEQMGLPEHGIAPGTRWDQIPADWVCPDCGTPKERFEMVAIPYAPGQPESSSHNTF